MLEGMKTRCSNDEEETRQSVTLRKLHDFKINYNMRKLSLESHNYTRLLYSCLLLDETGSGGR